MAMARWWRGGGALLRTAEAPPFLWRTYTAGYHTTIQAVPRELTGRRIAARERTDGRIPSVVLTPGDGGTIKHLVTVDRKQIRTILKKIPFVCSTTFKLQIRAGQGSTAVLHSGTVLPIKLHRDSKTGEILNLVMVWANKGSELTVDVPVVFKGEEVCPGLKKGGYLQTIRPTLKYLCPTEHIPQKIEVDLTKLDIEDRVFMCDIKLHPSLKLLSKNETMPICKISATKPMVVPEQQSPEIVELPKPVET